MSKLHDDIINLLNESSPQYKEINEWVGTKYLGTTRKFLGVKTPIKRKLAKQWKQEHTDISSHKLFSLIDELYSGKTFEEATFASELVILYPELRKNMDLNNLYIWIGKLHGWAEIDSLCQSTFHADEVLDRWGEWERLLIKLNNDEDNRRRRASLVLLRKTVSEKYDKKVSKISFNNIINLIQEEDVLITKAISWLLRSLIKNYREDVEEFISEYEEELPKIAIRETRRKLETGKK